VIYKGKDVWLLKKAQLAVADIYRHCYDKDSLISSDKISLNKYIEKMSVFADNVVVAVLRQLGAINIRDDLATKISKMEQLIPGSPEEIELRAISISVSDKLITRMQSKGIKILCLELDKYLWEFGTQTLTERHYAKGSLFYWTL